MRNHYSVPDGYFASLQSRLEDIPQSGKVSRGKSGSGLQGVFRADAVWLKPRILVPVAAVACLAVVVTAIVPGRQENTVESDLFDSQFFADIPYTDPYSVFQDMNEVEDFSQDFLEEYIIETGMSAEEFEYLLK